MASDNPQIITLKGRLSWPALTYADALRANERSKPIYKKKPDDVKPSFQLLLEQSQVDKLVAHLKSMFFPWCEGQGKVDGKSSLNAKDIKKLARVLDEQDWEMDTIPGLLYPIHEKTAPLAPEAVVGAKCNGFKKQDLEQKAVVRSESDLTNPLEDIIIPARGMILPIEDTKLELYPGCVAVAQFNLFAYLSQGTPGITASTGTIIFGNHADRFGGGGGVDDDDVFMELDD